VRVLDDGWSEQGEALIDALPWFGQQPDPGGRARQPQPSEITCYRIYPELQGVRVKRISSLERRVRACSKSLVLNPRKLNRRKDSSL
jgi:hypothetical protein